MCGIVMKVRRIVFSKDGRETISHAMISRTYPLPYPEGESDFPSLESGQTCDSLVMNRMWWEWIWMPSECRAQRETRHSHLDPKKEVQIPWGCLAMRQLKQPWGEAKGRLLLSINPGEVPATHRNLPISRVREAIPDNFSLQPPVTPRVPAFPGDTLDTVRQRLVIPCALSSFLPTLSESKGNWLPYATKFGVICHVAIVTGKRCSGDKILWSS